MRLFEVFHEHRDDDVDQDELRHEDKDDEKEGGEVGRDAAVLEAVVVGLAFLPQCVLRIEWPIKKACLFCRCPLRIGTENATRKWSRS